MTNSGERYEVTDISLAPTGYQRIEWAAREMPVLHQIRERFAREKPLQDKRVSACLHITAETANLIFTLKDGGADLVLCASNPLSTQDDVAAALAASGIAVFALRGEDEQTYYRHLRRAIDHHPYVTIDDGADLVTTLHKENPELASEVIGGTEETTTGVLRLKSMARSQELKYPIIAVNDAQTKYLFDNRYGTGQSSLDGITRVTNTLWAGKHVVVCGYGWCGRGVAMRARGMGSNVIITEVNPIRALEAVMDGFQAMPLEQAASIGEIYITVTGNRSVISRKHFAKMKSGAILANAGHFNTEIDIPSLEAIAVSKRKVRPLVDEYTLQDGRRIYLLAEGRLINLAGAEGHPPCVMDMSFANQALSLEYLIAGNLNLENRVYPVPSHIDTRIAKLKLASMDISIDSLTPEQLEYLNSWEEGT